METILAAVDNSPWTAVVAEYAADVARIQSARVLGVYVIDSRLVEGAFATLVGEEFIGGGGYEASESLAALLARDGEEALRIVASVCERKGVAFDKRLERGRPATAIASLAPLYDLAVVGTYGAEERHGGCLIGSTVSELTRLGTRPIMVVRKEYKPIAHAVVGYDGSPQATRALDTVIGLARSGGWRLTIAVAADHEPTGHELAGRAKQFRGLNEIQSETVVRPGAPFHVLLDVVEETGAGLIAVGARGMSKIAQFLLGSTSYTLLCQAPVPVMVFR